MVIVNLKSGLGNQLFQYAFGRALAHKLNTELKLDLTDAKISLQAKGHVHYRLGEFNIQENFATPEEIAHVKKHGKIPMSLYDLENFHGDVFIQGHWMHGEEAFNDVADIIRREFTLKNPLHKNSAAWQKKILAADCPVAMHIRHGDYLRGKNIHIAGAIPLAYYHTCAAELKKIFPNLTVFVFSDDLNWAQKNLKLDVPTEFVRDCELDTEEFHLMSTCKHNIIANSTFSWWAAWLNQNPDKKVFAPSPWTRSRLWDNGISDSWTKIPVDFENLPVESPPLISIVAYVKNNISTLPLFFGSVFSQTFRDYELILIDDASTDGSENFCRQVSLNKNVTLIASRRVNFGKAAAWNRGLDFARGEFVLFLSGNDLILPNAVHLFCQMYSLSQANMICAVQNFEENPAGNIVIGGINGKKFFHRTDPQFKALNAPMPFKSTDIYQKLMMTGTRVFNTLIGTKFFSRDFLIKNSLRFNENLSTGAELLFIVNAVMLCNEMLFIPEPFYIAPKI